MKTKRVKFLSFFAVLVAFTLVVTGCSSEGSRTSEQASESRQGSETSSESLAPEVEWKIIGVEYVDGNSQGLTDVTVALAGTYVGNQPIIQGSLWLQILDGAGERKSFRNYDYSPVDEEPYLVWLPNWTLQTYYTAYNIPTVNLSKGENLLIIESSNFFEETEKRQTTLTMPQPSDIPSSQTLNGFIPSNALPFGETITVTNENYQGKNNIEFTVLSVQVTSANIKEYGGNKTMSARIKFRALNKGTQVVEYGSINGIVWFANGELQRDSYFVKYTPPTDPNAKTNNSRPAGLDDISPAGEFVPGVAKELIIAPRFGTIPLDGIAPDEGSDVVVALNLGGHTSSPTNFAWPLWYGKATKQ
jgi:hypothetical protein